MPPIEWKEVTPAEAFSSWLDNPLLKDLPMKPVPHHPTDEDLRMLRDTYQHCRKWAQVGEVGRNAVTLIAALDELLERRAADNSEKQPTPHE